MKERLQKVLGRAGVASRRKAEEMIMDGRVSVNGEVVRTLGIKVTESEDLVAVDGKRVLFQRKYQYFVFYKPLGVLTTMKDDRGRKTVADFFGGVKERIYPVGRLDYNTDGLLIMTNNGEAAYRLTHPKYKVDKKYVVRLDELPSAENINRLVKGIVLDDGLTAPAKVRVLSEKEKIYTSGCEVEIIIREGRKRQVRRMFEIIGHPVVSLRRVGFAFLSLDSLCAGEYRCMKDDEVLRLRSLIGL